MLLYQHYTEISDLISTYRRTRRKRQCGEETGGRESIEETKTDGDRGFGEVVIAFQGYVITVGMKVNQMKKYDEYLEMVKERNPGQFLDINNILNRYETLKEANNDLTRKQNILEQEIEQIQKENDSYEKEKTSEILLK